jgi:tetratricopeptide (TPR) repeat protein
MKIDVNDLYDHGTNKLKEGDFNAASECFNTLLDHDPTSEAYIFGLACAESKRGHSALGLLLYKHILDKNKGVTEAWSNSGCVYKTLEKFNDAKKCFHEAIKIEEPRLFKEKTPENINKIKVNLADFYSNLASMYVATGDPKEAINYCNKGLIFVTDSRALKWNRALAYLEMGDYEKGFEDYEHGVRIQGDTYISDQDRPDRNYHPHGTPRWDGTKGVSVVVYGEQGIGDELMFASVIPDLMKDCKVIIDAHPRLADLFRETFPNVPVYGTRKEAGLPWSQYHNIDYKIAMGSLGKFYRKKKEDFPGTPYLKVPEALIQKYKERLSLLGNKRKIGISWKGGVKTTNRSSRHIPLEMWTQILSLDADFISLQYHEDAQEDVDRFQESHPDITIHHWKDVLDDYDETAGLVANLDLIISVPQSVIHLAGAIGTETYQLCPKRALWQMGPYKEDMPWYESVTNIWQGHDEKWEPVLDAARQVALVGVSK